MTFKIIPATLVLILFSLTTFGQTFIDTTLQHDGLTREYRIYVPDIYDGSQPVPMVLNFHGYGSNNIQQTFYGEFRPIADTANFILVLPQGTKNNVNQSFWNTFGGPETVDDVGFVSNLIDTISAGFNIDQNRIYSTGMSNGGFMSYKLACELSDRITAIASVTGSMIFPEVNSCAPPRPMPVMQIHGTADEVVAYDGGGVYIHMDSLVNFWVNHNNCSPDPVFTPVPDINNTDNCTAEHYLYENGELGSTVEFYKIIGGQHSWPGTIINLNVTNRDFDASKEIWRFFSQYELNGLLTSVESPLPEIFSVSVYPNPSDGQFNLEFQDFEEKTVFITNSFGQKIHQIITEKSNIELNIESPGIYFISVEKGGWQQTRKVIVF